MVVSRLGLVRAAFFRLLPLAACCLVLGCGGKGKLYRLSGNVTFNGKPVPAGKIYITPDGARNNSGPPGFADIKDGQYDTQRKGGQGFSGGPMVVRIEGTDVANGLVLNYETQVDLPAEAVAKDFDVPASAAQSLPQTPLPPP